MFYSPEDRTVSQSYSNSDSFLRLQSRLPVKNKVATFFEYCS